MTNVFERVYTDETPDAVTVRVFVVDGQTVAEAVWDPRMGSYGMVVGPALGNPQPVPNVLSQAIRTQRSLALQRVVILLEGHARWSDEWGTLR
jgi:hypothetical protein